MLSQVAKIEILAVSCTFSFLRAVKELFTKCWSEQTGRYYTVSDIFLSAWITEVNGLNRKRPEIKKNFQFFIIFGLWKSFLVYIPDHCCSQFILSCHLSCLGNGILGTVLTNPKVLTIGFDAKSRFISGRESAYWESSSQSVKKSRKAIRNYNQKSTRKLYQKLLRKVSRKLPPQKNSLNLWPKISPQISPVFRQLLRLHVWDVLEHSVQYFLQIVSQTHQLKPTIDMCCYHVQEELLGSTKSRDRFGGTGGVWARTGPCSGTECGVRPWNNSLDSIARFALLFCWTMGFNSLFGCSCSARIKGHQEQAYMLGCVVWKSGLDKQRALVSREIRSETFDSATGKSSLCCKRVTSITWQTQRN